jgi:hypothetical protein
MGMGMAGLLGAAALRQQTLVAGDGAAPVPPPPTP